MPDEKRQDEATAPARGPSGGEGGHVARPFDSPLPDAERQRSPERSEDRKEPGASAAAGPHSQPSLTNPDATPGAGTLPEAGRGAGDEDIDIDAATG